MFISLINMRPTAALNGAIIGIMIGWLLVVAPSRGSTVDEWTLDANQTFSDTAAWSLGIVPDNTDFGTDSNTYEALIDAGGNPYSVDIKNGYTLDELVVNSPVATVVDTGRGTLTIGTVDVEAGTFSLDGTVSQANFEGSGTILLNGSMDAATISTNVVIDGGAGVTDGLTLNTGVLHLGFNGNSAGLDFRNTSQTVTGTGTISMEGESASIGTWVGTTLTFDSGVTISAVSGGNYLGVSENGSSGDTLVINGYVRSETPNSYLAFEGGSALVNNGTLSAANGGLINIASTLSNLGTFTTNGGSGTVELSGTLYNTGNTLNLTDILTMNGGTITGGEVEVSGNGSLSFQGGTLNNVTLDPDITATDSGTLEIANGITLNGSTIHLQSSTDGGVCLSLANSNAATISGNGTISFEGANPISVVSAVSGVFTVGSGVTVATHGASGYFEEPNYNSPSFANDGTLLVQDAGQSIGIATRTFTNNGTILVTEGSFNCSANYMLSSTGTISVGSSGQANFSGTALQITGGVLTGAGDVEGGDIVVAGGTVAPSSSNGPAVLTLGVNSGNTTFFGAKGTYIWKTTSLPNSTSDPNTGAGFNWDLLNLSALTISSTTPTTRFTIKLISIMSNGQPGPLAGYTAGVPYAWTIATTVGGINDLSVPVNLDLTEFDGGAVQSAMLEVVGDNLEVVVPEPRGIGLLVLSGLALSRRRRITLPSAAAA